VLEGHRRRRSNREMEPTGSAGGSFSALGGATRIGGRNGSCTMQRLHIALIFRHRVAKQIAANVEQCGAGGFLDAALRPTCLLPFSKSSGKQASAGAIDDLLAENALVHELGEQPLKGPETAGALHKRRRERDH
jgi:hypothetical protein